MAKKTAKQKYRLGSVVAVPLPGGKFAFVKVFKEHDFGVYDLVSKQIEPLDKILKRKIAFFQSGTDSAIKSGRWPVVGEDPFPDEESAWGPPRAAGVLPGSGLGKVSPMVIEKGISRHAKLEEVLGLDIDEFAHSPELFVEVLVDRLVKGEHDAYKVHR
jgi:hypothetical protein